MLAFDGILLAVGDLDDLRDFVEPFVGDEGEKDWSGLQVEI